MSETPKQRAHTRASERSADEARSSKKPTSGAERAVRKPATPSNKKPSDRGFAWKPFFARKRVLIPIAVLVLLCATMAMYYTPLKIWYREAREERVLREQLLAIQEYNDGLKLQIESLETTEGVQDYATRELGLIQKGDHAIVVLQGGKPLKESNNTREQEIQQLQETAQPFGSWTPFLDEIFGAK